MTVSQKVKALRMSAGSSQEELATAAALSLRTIQRIENGETQPRGDSLKRLARALGVPTEELTDQLNLPEPAQSHQPDESHQPAERHDNLPTDKGFLIVLHLSALSFLLFPIFHLFSVMSILAPLILWLLKRDKIEGVRLTGKKILNFQLTWFLVFALIYGYVFVCKLNHTATFVDQLTLLRILVGLYLFNIVSVVVNILRLGKGKTILYQPAIPFVPVAAGLFCGLFFACSAYGQVRVETIHFSPKPIHFEDSLFHNVIVVDSRFDTSSEVNITQGKKNIFIYEKWDTTLSAAIHQYVQSLLGALGPAGSGTLLIDLRRYQWNGNGKGTHFLASAWYSVGDGYRKFASLDTIFRRRPRHYLKGAAINVFLEMVMHRRRLGENSSDPILSLSAIEQNNISHDWESLPINTAEHYPSGVYEGYTTLRNNEPYDYALHVDKRQDGLYAVSFTDTLKEKKQRIAVWLYYRGRGVISYNGQLYYLLSYPVCLPLERRKNTFYFHIPPSLPNMYYLDRARAEGLASPSSGQVPIRNTGDAVAAVGVFFLDYYSQKAMAKWLWKQGLKDPAFRDCYIDLGTGYICYH